MWPAAPSKATTTDFTVSAFHLACRSGNPSLRHHQNYFVRNATADQVTSLQAYYNDSENIYAGYAEGDVTFGRLNILGGFRIEATQAVYGAFANSPGTDPHNPASYRFVYRNSDYSNVFPDFQALYKINDTLQARFSYSTAIGRPTFGQITASTIVDSVDRLVRHSSGCPMAPKMKHLAKSEPWHSVRPALGALSGLLAAVCARSSAAPLRLFERAEASPYQHRNACYAARSFARFSNRVYSLRNVKGTSPVGPFRCFAMMSSASPALRSFSSSSVA
jgi:Outer membrane protein beta-barrel family